MHPQETGVRIRKKWGVRTRLLCHAVRVQKENVSTRRSREKQRRKGATSDEKKKLLPGSLTSREPSRERQRAGLVARRKALGEGAASSVTLNAAELPDGFFN
jgi:hypothetical protein